MGGCCAEQADDGSKQDPRGACPQGQPGGFPIERQDVLNVSPIHCTFFLSKQMTDDCSQKKAQQAVCKLPGRYDFRVILPADYSEREHK